jgi:DNA-directed RNA polymerase specialized sigma24 family protein
MNELSLPGVQQKKDWTLTPRALDQLLTWLDEGSNSDGLRYLEMRRRLVSYFDRKNCSTSHELADETVNRVSRRLEEEGAIANETPAKYCYIVARFVFMEYLRAMQKEHALVDDLRRQPVGDNPGLFDADDQKEIKEKRLDCLEQCTGQLEPRNREIILRYYVGKERVKIENRRGLAAELSITMNALSIRACRIRDKLEACVKQCLGVK